MKSGTASIKDVEGFLNKQSLWDYKPGKALAKSVLKPDHFETMSVKIANELWSNDVIAALDYMHESKKETKASATSFLLRQFNKWTKIMSDSTFTSIDQFEEIVPFLEEFMMLVDNLVFEKSRIKHQTGAVWSTQDALENVFSQTDAAALKPSALQFLYATRTVTINQGMLKKVQGSSYSFDEEEAKGTNFLETIATNNNHDDDDDHEMSFTENFNIPDVVSSHDVFGTDPLKADAFYCVSNDFLRHFAEKLKCSTCHKELINEIPAMTNPLKRHREDRRSEQTTKATEILLKFEYVFKNLQDKFPSDHFLKHSKFSLRENSNDFR